MRGWLRHAIPGFIGGVLSLALVVFIVASGLWFARIVFDDDPDLSAEQAFLGLGYLAGVVLVVLVVWAVVRYSLGNGSAAGPHQTDSPSGPGARRDDDRRIVLAQLRYGALLIVFGAVVGIVFGLAFDDDKGVALALGTAALGAGAAILPGGASASANARLNKPPGNGNGNGRPGAGGPNGGGPPEATARPAPVPDEEIETAVPDELEFGEDEVEPESRVQPDEPEGPAEAQ